MDKIEELLTRGVANIIPSKIELEKILKAAGKKLNVYLGIDPTATKIHLGHTVPLRKLQAFADLGHNVTFLIGDFTALVGDTSDKDSERPVLTTEQIEQNFRTYKKQAEKVLDFSKITVRYNSEWLKDLDFKRILQLCLQFSLNDFISRELIRKRLDKGTRVGLHEVLYPVMQGYDSYKLETDVQIGGTDQTFNMQAGRTLFKNWVKPPKESFILTTEFLMGTDGRKMSKTWGNAIWIEDNPNDMYAKVMAIKDDLIIQYYLLATNVPTAETEKIELQLKSQENPIKIKKDLAYRIVMQFHSLNDAKKAAKNFKNTIQKQELPKDIPIYQYTGSKNVGIIHLLVQIKLASSHSEAKRLVEQGGVTIDYRTPTAPHKQIEIKNGMIIRVGKRKFVRIKMSV